MYIAVLSVKCYPIAIGFNHDTDHTWLYQYHGLQKSVLSHLQVLNCLEETKFV